MGNNKEINTKNRTYYLFNYMINIEKFNPDLLKIDKKSYKSIIIGIYFIGYITTKHSDYVKINSANTFFLIICEVDQSIEKYGSKYLTFVSTDKNKEVLENYTELWNKIKIFVEKLNDKSGKYERYYTKIKFNSDDIYH